MARESLASMTREELRERLVRLREMKTDAAALLVFLDTPFGKRWAQARRDSLEETRNSYAKIEVEAQSPEQTARQLIAVITKEKLLSKEVVELESAKKLIDGLDAELKSCHSALEVREKAARGSR